MCGGCLLPRISRGTELMPPHPKKDIPSTTIRFHRAPFNTAPPKRSIRTSTSKPKTFVKNWSCVALVAMSPMTSGLAAWEVFCSGMGSVANTAAIPQFKLVLQSPLAYLVVALFAGITSREILMDVTDCESDAKMGIRTVPVKYGRGWRRLWHWCNF